MKEARIIFPVEGPMNAAFQSCVTNIIHAFGGATIFSANGHWKAPNGMFEDEIVRIADIAYEPSDENDAKLFDLAWDFLKKTNQVEMYLRYGNGHVQLVTEKSCMDNGHGHFDLEFGGILNAITTLTDPGQSVEDRVSAFEYLQGSTVNRKDAA